MKKKILIFVLSIMCFMSFPMSVYAMEYGNDYPKYVDYSGGAYIEVQSTLGRGTLIFQDSYQTGYFGFVDSGYNLCNISNSTLTGRYITSTGTEYQARFSAFSTPQYYYTLGNIKEWRDFNVSKIYNTNVEFIDYTENERDNVIDPFNGDWYQYTVVCFLMVILVFVVVGFIRSKRS